MSLQSANLHRLVAVTPSPQCTSRFSHGVVRSVHLDTCLPCACPDGAIRNSPTAPDVLCAGLLVLSRVLSHRPRPLWVHGRFAGWGVPAGPSWGSRPVISLPVHLPSTRMSHCCHVRLPRTLSLPSSRTEVCVPPLSAQGLHPRTPIGALLESTSLRCSADSGPPPLGGWTPGSPESGMLLSHPELVSRFLRSP